MNIEYLGHSCFKITANNGYSVVIDPYKKGSIPGLRAAATEANAVLCSHEHFDHNAADEVKLADTSINNPFAITEIETYHDHHEGSKRGMNKVYILEEDGCRIAHLGDLGCIPTAEIIEQLAGVDILLIPVGGRYTIDKKEAVALISLLKPNTVIPMHYRGDGYGLSDLDTIDGFEKLVTEVCKATYGEAPKVIIAEPSRR